MVGIADFFVSTRICNASVLSISIFNAFTSINPIVFS